MAETKYTDNVVIEGSDETKVQLAVQGDTSQEKALQTWEDDIDTRLAQVSKEGYVQVGDDLDDALANALIEAQRDEDSTAKPKRGLNLIGRIKDTLNTTISWVAQELQLVGSSGVDAQHTAVRGRLNNDNTGAMTANGELRGGDFEVTNKAADATPREGTAIGVRAAVTNQSSGYIKDMIGVQIELNNENTATDPIDTAYGLKIEDVEDATNNYAIHTGLGEVQFGDEVLIKTGSAGSYTVAPNSEDLVIESELNTGLSIVSKDNQLSTLAFGTPSQQTGAHLQWNNSQGELLVSATKSGADLNLRADADVILSPGGTEVMRIDNAGNVGIGDASPDHKLDVAGIIRVQQRLQVTGNTSPSTGIGVEIGHSGTDGVLLSYKRDSPAEYKNMRYNALSHEFEVSGSDAVVIDTNGDVGIGTSSPNGTLHVRSGSAGLTPGTGGDDLFVENSDNAGITIAAPNNDFTSIYFAHPVDVNSAIIQYGETLNRLWWGTHRSGGSVAIMSGNWSEAIRIDSAGKVGIGDSSPDYKLDVAGTLGVDDYGVFLGGVHVGGTSDPGTDRLIVDGDVAIGSTSFADKLHVNGIIRATGYRTRTTVSGGTYGGNKFNINWTNPNAQLYIDQTNIGTFATASDARIKRDIASIRSTALERVKQLNPVTYYFRNSGLWRDTGEQYEGFIANELESVIPSAVFGEADALTIDGDPQPQTLTWMPIVAVLTKAVQELSAEVDQLKGR